MVRSGNVTSVLDVGREEFEELVDRALDEVPDELAQLVHNVVVLVEDEPLPGEPPDLLGLYDGIALTERQANHVDLPDRIFIFRNPLLAFCRDEEELVEQVRITVVHEIAHHFGIKESRLHELGYG